MMSIVLVVVVLMVVVVGCVGSDAKVHISIYALLLLVKQCIRLYIIVLVEVIYFSVSIFSEK